MILETVETIRTKVLEPMLDAASFLMFPFMAALGILQTINPIRYPWFNGIPFITSSLLRFELAELLEIRKGDKMRLTIEKGKETKLIGVKI